MLEKIPGTPLSTKLRIIQFLEDDFNLYLKIKIIRELMNHVEKHDLISKELYGGLHGRTTHDALLIQTFVITLCSQPN